jgi:hypothetical protein
MKMVLRSLYLDPQVDIDLGNRADDEGVTKAELMRRFLDEGLSRPATKFAAYAKRDAEPAPVATVAAPKPAPKRDKKPAIKPQPARRVASSRR